MATPMLARMQALLRGAFTQNLRIKALALGITILVFALVKGGRETTARLNVDVEVLRPDATAERVLVTEIPESVKLRVQGSYHLVQMMSDEEMPPVTLDLRNAPDGPFLLDKAPFRIPPGLEVVAVTPAALDLRFEPRETKQVRVVPVLAGQVADGHHVKDPVGLEPAEVGLSGPRSGVQAVTEVDTAAVDLTGLGPGQHTRRVPLEPPPPGCRYVGVEHAVVTIVVEADLFDRVLPGIPVQVRGTTAPATAETVTVTVHGPEAAVTALRAESVTAFVELASDVEPGQHRAEVRIDGIAAPLEATVAPPTVIVEVTAAQAGQAAR